MVRIWYLSIYLSIHSLPTYIRYFARAGASCCGVPTHPTRPRALWYAYVIDLFIDLFIVYPHRYIPLHVRTEFVRVAAAWSAALAGPRIGPGLHGTHMLSIYLYVYTQSTHIHALLCTGWCELLRRGLLRSQAYASDPVSGASSMVRICYLYVYISIHRRFIIQRGHEHTRTGN